VEKRFYGDKRGSIIASILEKTWVAFLEEMVITGAQRPSLPVSLGVQWPF